MTDRETSTLLGKAADRVPVGPAPVGQLLKAGRRARRRRTAGVSLAVAAGVAVVAGGVVTVVDPPDGQGDAAGSAAALSADEPRAGGPEAADAAPGTGMPPADGGDDPAAGSELSPLPEDPTAGRTGPLDSAPTSSCAVEYSPAALSKQEFAFAGVVVGIGPAVTARPGLPGPPEDLVGVTFAVQEWFTGGPEGTVTVDLPAPYDPAAGSSTPGPVYGLGSRLLVSGADRWEGAPLEPIAWLCGFTRYYDEETAAAWR